ncbi:hypothetical protein [Cryptosporangium aurantiacum]|uniref:Uncharacterized protein n=1 Tax=Cryptosporangium aurantiacum TaxID=134849 RepID=A0A1M7R8A2_9ACTN|nr:hypothetical protein [Cryptosporangium aurantiacum]SHN42463.1 hypothetical protein SAMN05443668_108217 [Cryptosporangium aurantiacum]
MLRWLVDRLPHRLWRAGNFHFFVGGRATLHFCVGADSERTIEVNGRELLRGRPGGASNLTVA